VVVTAGPAESLLPPLDHHEVEEKFLMRFLHILVARLLATGAS